MGYIMTGGVGKTLKEIINNYGNKDYQYIEFRCKWVDDNWREYDDFFGACKYENGKLIPLDGDCYYLDDQYIDSKEWINTEYKDLGIGANCLTVWEYGKWAMDL